MTERPMWDGGPGEHPDEGTIHAWLDGAIDAASSARVEAHVRGCAACSALTAEARGLIAGASRVVAALDDVPAGARPAWAQSEVGGSGAEQAPASDVARVDRVDRSLWRRLRVTPARAAIAATIIVAAGLTLTHERAAKESVVTLPAGHSELRSGEGGERLATVPPAAQPRKDATLDSAVAKNLSIAQGKPSIEASRLPAIPQAPAPAAAPVETAPVAVAEQRVAAGRAAVQALRDTTAPAPDKLRVGREVTGAVAARAADEVAVSAPARKEMSGASARESVAGVAQGYADAGARSCYSLESAQSGAMWGDQPLPLAVVVDSGPAVGTRNATLRSAATGTEVRAAWKRSGGDSVVITLERVGLAGTIALGPEAGGRAGLASSGGIASSAMASARAGSAARARAKSEAPPHATTVVPGTSAERVPKTAPLAVTLRPVACPAH